MIGMVAVIGTFDGFDSVDTGIGMVVVIGTFDGCDSVGSGIGTVAMIGIVVVIGTVLNCYYRKERSRQIPVCMAYIVVCHTTDCLCTAVVDQLHLHRTTHCYHPKLGWKQKFPLSKLII